MSNTKNFIIINPVAEADVVRMNEILRAATNYINGVEFTYSEVIEGGSVQFFYDYPEEFTSVQVAEAHLLVNNIYTDYMASRIVTG